MVDSKYYLMFCPITRYLLYVTLSSFFPLYSVMAEDVDLQLAGWLGMAGQYSKASPTDLIADPYTYGYDKRFAQVVGMANVRLKSDRLYAQSQLRFESVKSKREMSLDEAYGELLLADPVLLYAGRRILSYGQAYGLNPVDLLRDPISENSIYSDAQARSMVQGDDLIGIDVIFDFNNALGLIYLPNNDNPRLNSKESIPMMRYSGFVVSSGLDYSASIIGGKRAGVGLSFSQVVGGSSVLYLDATLRRGREKRVLSGTAPSGALLVEARKAHGLYPFATIGLGYTFENNVSTNLELSHDAGGYSDHEWAQVLSTLEVISPAQSAVQKRSLGQLNGILNHYTLRQNYAFLRVSNDRILDRSISGEITTLYGVDDGSGRIGLRFETSLGERTTTGFYTTHRFGGNNDEFMLRPRVDTFSLYASINF